MCDAPLHIYERSTPKPRRRTERTDVTVVVGAGGIGLAIVHRISSGRHVLLSDHRQEAADAAAKLLENAGFETTAMQAYVSDHPLLSLGLYVLAYFLVVAFSLPGGLGTLEELFEVWTWGQLGYHAKPLGLLEVDGFYARLTDFLDHLVAERFVREPHRAMLQVGESPAELLDRLEAWQPTAAPKWVDREPK